MPRHRAHAHRAHGHADDVRALKRSAERLALSHRRHTVRQVVLLAAVIAAWFAWAWFPEWPERAAFWCVKLINR